MDDRDTRECIYHGSEVEWRRYLTAKIDKVEERLASITAWTLVFRVVGGGLVTLAFAVLIAYVEFRFNSIGHP